MNIISGKFKIENRKGFTLIELMIVILIVAILASVGIPITRGCIDAAKWSEGKVEAGTIAKALLSYAVEKGTDGTYPPTLVQLGFLPDDLKGTYFNIGNYSIPAASFNPGANPELTYTIQVENTALRPSKMTLDHTGTWTNIP